MKKSFYENVVIGAGSGGLTAAIGLARFGREVALIEANHVGGDCTNVGCIPSKTLIHLAKEFKPGDDPAEVLKRVTKRRNDFRDEEAAEVSNIENLELIMGTAKFIAPRKLAVILSDGVIREISAKNIVISTGARPRILDIPGLPKDRLLTNESLFDIQSLPKHLAIVGAGIIAVELAIALRKLGSEITMIALDPRMLPTYSQSVSEAIQPEIEKRGIKTFYQSTGESFDAKTRTLIVRSGDKTFPVKNVDKVLLAVGRLRNIDDLGLENTGIDFDRGGVKVDNFGRTDIPGIFAIGDVTPTSAFTHSANAQGRRLVQKIVFPWLPMKRDEPIFPTATFSDPEVATTGLNDRQISEKFHPELVKVLRLDFKDTDRGYSDEIEHGFIEVKALRLTGRILNATIVGPYASEMISYFTLAISRKISLYKLSRIVYPYPTFSSSIQKISDNYMRETLPNLLSEIGIYIRSRFFRNVGKKSAVKVVQLNGQKNT